MGKNKLARFAELETIDLAIQPSLDEVLNRDYELKNNWRSKFFKNDNPITLELGCGKGEYTIGLAERFPERNFIGIDIKGARIWRGAKSAVEKKLTNVGFLRTRIEFITSFFGTGEISEIWVTFPDPQAKDRRAKKRLTGPAFLESYRKFLQPGGFVHLKTDSELLHNYTKALIETNKMDVLECTDDLYNSEISEDILSIKTHYENLFLKEGKKITYLKFVIPEKGKILDVPDDSWKLF